MTIQEIITALEAGQTGREIDETVGALFAKSVTGDYGEPLIDIDCGAVSTSLDAVVALQDRVLPGLGKTLTEYSAGGTVAAIIGPGNARLHHARAPTLAAAWLAAILKAHMAKETA